MIIEEKNGRFVASVPVVDEWGDVEHIEMGEAFFSDPTSDTGTKNIQIIAASDGYLSYDCGDAKTLYNVNRELMADMIKLLIVAIIPPEHPKLASGSEITSDWEELEGFGHDYGTVLYMGGKFLALKTMDWFLFRSDAPFADLMQALDLLKRAR